MQAHGTMVIGIGLALTGIAMIAVLGPRMLQQPWLLVALAIYAIEPRSSRSSSSARPCAGSSGSGIQTDDDRARGGTRARRQRYVSYAMAGLVGTIGFLMSTKPQLW